MRLSAFRLLGQLFSARRGTCLIYVFKEIQFPVHLSQGSSTTRLMEISVHRKISREAHSVSLACLRLVLFTFHILLARECSSARQINESDRLQCTWKGRQSGQRNGCVVLSISFMIRGQNLPGNLPHDARRSKSCAIPRLDAAYLAATEYSQTTDRQGNRKSGPA